jgi:probable F420-dependent oxidoreductase
MLLDAVLPPKSLTSIPEIAREAEAIGFDCLWLAETTHDPFLAATLLAEHTRTSKFGTAVAIAFARSPTTLAYTAWDLADISAGRFILGLGTQVKPHIVRRYGMEWPESPVKKLREQIEAIRAIWRTWQSGEKLNFRGEYYKLTLMSPFFNPGPIGHPSIPIYIAGVNTGMAGLAGETADGFHVHPFHSPKYLAEVLLPAIEKGVRRAERDRPDVVVAAQIFTITNDLERELARQQIAFYASTPSYLAVMELHGWGEVAGELSQIASQGKWVDMPSLITDEMLEAFAVVAEPHDLPSVLETRYRGLVDRFSLYLPFTPGERDPFWRSVAQAFPANP